MNKVVNSIEAKDIANHFHPYTNPKILRETGPHVICKGEGIYVYDNTGIGRDSFILASAGYRVHMFEKNKILHSLLEDGMTKVYFL